MHSERIEGKTKVISPTEDGKDRVIVRSKSDITAGDGARHEVMDGKARLSNLTTCHVFDFLKLNQSAPLAYIEKCSELAFLADFCTMIPLEIVTRCAANGSYLKRNPTVTKGERFDAPIVEFHYKTTGRKIGNCEIECDDPFLQFSEDGRAFLYNPAKPLDTPFMELILDSPLLLALLHSQMRVIEQIALEVCYALARAWEAIGGELIDFKIECGINRKGEIVVADVIDLDSWRVVYQGQEISKQPFREGASVEETLKIYELGEELTRQFATLRW